MSYHNNDSWRETKQDENNPFLLWVWIFIFFANGLGLMYGTHPLQRLYRAHQQTTGYQACVADVAKQQVNQSTYTGPSIDMRFSNALTACENAFPYADK